MGDGVNQAKMFAKVMSGTTKQFAQSMASDAARMAEVIRLSMVSFPKGPITPLELGRCSQICSQVLLELAKGDIEDLYAFLAPYVKAKFEKRMAKRVSDD